MNKLVKWFLQGLVILVPMLITLWVAYRVFQTVDGMIDTRVPGVGFAVTVGLITFIGFLGSTVLGGVFVYLESLFARLPLLKILYTAVKDLLEAFAGDKRKFDQPVTVQLVPGGKAKLVGFVTQPDLAALGLPGEVAVYCPHSYNFSGQLILVPRRMVRPLKGESAQVMAFTVSGGVASLDG